jgi:hypothetical protein
MFWIPGSKAWVAGQRDLDLLEQFLYNHGGVRAVQGQDDQVDDEIRQVHLLSSPRRSQNIIKLPENHIVG